MIVIDTDFLSSFLKIDRLGLIFLTLEVNEIVIARAVFHEVEQAPIYGRLLEALQSENQRIIVTEVTISHSEDFGRGEMESISLAQISNGLLLMNDRKATRFAESRGVTVMDIPMFLFFCKTNNYVSNKELTQIIEDLKEKDYYEFSAEIKETLLK